MSPFEQVRNASNSIKGREFFLDAQLSASVWSERRVLLKTVIKETKTRIGLQRREKSRIFNAFCGVKLRYCKCLKKPSLLLQVCIVYFVSCSAIPLLFDFNKFTKTLSSSNCPTSCHGNQWRMRNIGIDI